MKNKILLLLSASFFFFSCKKEMKKEQVNADSIATAVGDSKMIDMHNSQNSLDWTGIYKGIIPCADCEGIETEIVLNKDLTFIMRAKYLGKGDSEAIEKKRNFVWDDTGSMISLNGSKDEYYKYKVGENTLTQLDKDGKMNTGPLADKFILKK